MILAYIVLAAVLVSYLTGGRLRYYAQRQLRGIWLPIAAFALEALCPLAAQNIQAPVAGWLWIPVSLQYALLFLFCGLNIKRRPVWLISLAAVMNFAAIASHQFRMPVSPLIYSIPQLSATAERIGSGELFEYVIVSFDSPLWWLGDALMLPFLPGGLASVGDLLLAAGAGWLVFESMRPLSRSNKVEKTVQNSRNQ